jgi:hypothetical protein
MTTRTFTFRVSSAPTWFTSMSHKQWATPMSNYLGSAGVVDPLATVEPNRGNNGVSSIITTWVGTLYDTSRHELALLGAGGHESYGGNEVYAAQLNRASPAWTRLRSATLAEAHTGTVYTAWPDGTPPSDHTGHQQVYGNGRWLKLGLGSPNWGGPPRDDQWWEYNRAAGTWTDLGSGHMAGSNAITSCALYDSVNGHFIKIRGQPTTPSVEFIDHNTLAVVKTAQGGVTSPGWNTSRAVLAAIDPVRRLLVAFSWVGAVAPAWLFVMDLNNTSAGWSVRVPITGTPPASLWMPVYWHTPSNAFITWDEASGIRKLTPTISGGTYTAATWSTVTSGFTGITPTYAVPASSQKWYSRVRLVENFLGTTDSALLVLAQYASPSLHVMKITGAV